MFRFFKKKKDKDKPEVEEQQLLEQQQDVWAEDAEVEEVAEEPVEEPVAEPEVIVEEVEEEVTETPPSASADAAAGQAPTQEEPVSADASPGKPEELEEEPIEEPVAEPEEIVEEVEAELFPEPEVVVEEPVAEPEIIVEEVEEEPEVEEEATGPTPTPTSHPHSETLTPDTPTRSWLGRLRTGLSKSATKLTGDLGGIFTKRKLDDELLEELEDVLITADFGVHVATSITTELAKTRYDKEITTEEVKELLAEQVAKILEPVAKPLEINRSHKPHVILMTGVNGNGKTTTLGKLANQYKKQGLSVMIVACDTFRAAAVDQLQVWADRAGCPCITGKHEADPASVAFTAYEQAKAEGVDVLLVDTAGRLQNKKNLMEELAKIVRVIQKQDEAAPHTTLLVLDATTGQNAHSQMDAFKDMVDVNGMMITKLDGTAKGGVVVSLAQKYGVPIHAIGVGEGIDDLHSFEAESFAESLVGE